MNTMNVRSIQRPLVEGPRCNGVPMSIPTACEMRREHCWKAYQKTGIVSRRRNMIAYPNDAAERNNNSFCFV
jgi:hypothetical protein